MAGIIQTQEPIHAVHVDGLAVLKIVKHCQESLPNLVAGTLLGLDINNGVLEITHAFPNPEPTKATPTTDNENGEPTQQVDGVDYSLEMLKMLREVNVDNNCVGFYQSISLGTFNTAKLVEEQFAYQADSDSAGSSLQVAVLILFDPIQTTRGNLCLKCLRLTSEAIDMLKSNKNVFLDPKSIFEELPVTIKNPSLVKALLHNVSSGQYAADVEEEEEYKANSSIAAAPVYEADTTFDRLDLSTNPYLEKHLEFMCTWVDELSAEQNKFQYYMRGLRRMDKRNKDSNKDKEKVDAADAWASNDAPRRLESLLISNQIRTYCDQVDQFADGGLGKLFVVDGLHRDDK
jgi:translation initiation factor 3 subunit H